ncbi:MAG: hypothetical protein A3F25_00695 [Candidatus Yanofskybacteria bacterium RIFCSPHIGHO2_12_FULL_45_19b]|uniref:Uncharacterized protein n=1 Tax=Candidatus Yanofskybacteria bacterium RIFCSPHIGHO2_12_FULL_45_19b TaxID=1802689 RepID=A0A1F8G6V5_9BACT|nr:MAG: hypothetical protein A3F25_00695 [Candidatus Yanofskybacteria bacterium RIFCSPHIGHO2_12_FULL_45_19b]
MLDLLISILLRSTFDFVELPLFNGSFISWGSLVSFVVKNNEAPPNLAGLVSKRRSLDVAENELEIFT